MTPEQKIKHLVLVKLASFSGGPAPEATDENIDALYQVASDNDDGDLQDAREEIRSGGTETKLECEISRHYESKAVAAQAVDGSWVGWVYWYGGGKHGEPQAVDWMDKAYDLTCAEDQKLVTVRTFTRVAGAAQ